MELISILLNLLSEQGQSGIQRLLLLLKVVDIHFERRDSFSQFSLLPLFSLELALKKEYRFRSYFGAVDELFLLLFVFTESLLHIHITVEVLSELTL